MAKVFDIAFKLGGEVTSSFKNAFNGAESTMTKLGAAAVAIGGVVGFSQLAGQIGEMDEALRKLSAQTGTYGEDMEELGNIAENLFRNNYGESFEEITVALANVKQNMHNLDNGELERMTGNALIFASTFDSDINEVTRAAQNMMENFGSSTTTTMDLFTAGMQRGLNFSDEMLDNIAEYSPLFAAMGYSAEEYFGIMERGAQAGVYNLDYVNDVMKEFQIRIKDGSKTTNDAMSEMSESTQAVWNDFLVGNTTVSEVASTVVSELKNMDDQVYANQIAVSLFGTKWEDLEASAMYAMLGSQEAMTGFEGAMEQVNTVKFDSFQSAITGIGRILLTDLVYPIGDFLLPHLNTFGNFLSNNLPGSIDKTRAVLAAVTPWVVGIGAAFLGYKGTLMAVTTYQKSFNTIQKLSTALMKAHRTAMLASTFAGGGFKGMLVGLRSGMAALNMTMLANPFVLAAAAIAGLAVAFVALYKKSETFRTAIEPLVQMVKTEFVAMGAQIGATFQAFAPMFVDLASSIIPIITNLAQMVIPLILQAVQMVFPLVLSIIQAVLPIVFTLIQTVVTIALTLAETVFPLILTVVQAVFPIVLSIIQMVIPIVSTILQTLVTIIQTVVVPAINLILSVIQFVFPYIQLIIQNALAIVNGIFTAAMALLTGDWDGAWNAIKGTAVTIMNNIIGFFKGINLFDIGKSIIDGLINGIKSMGSAVLGAITDMVPEPIRAAASGVMDALGIGGYAEGGIVNRPELAWIGEGGDTEAVIPWNNSQRSKDLWMATGDALGMWDTSEPEDNPFDFDSPNYAFSGNSGSETEGSTIIQVTDQRQITIQGNTDPGQVEREMNKSNQSLLAQLEEEFKNKKRGDFN